MSTSTLDVTHDGCIDGDDVVCRALLSVDDKRVSQCVASQTRQQKAADKCCRAEQSVADAETLTAYAVAAADAADNSLSPDACYDHNACPPFGTKSACVEANNPIVTWHDVAYADCVDLCAAKQLGDAFNVGGDALALCCQHDDKQKLCSLSLGNSRPSEESVSMCSY